VAYCNGCNLEIPTTNEQKEILDHVKKCPHLNMTCSNCNKVFLKHEILKHENKCLENLNLVLPIRKAYRLEQTLKGHFKEVNCVVMLPNGHLVSGGNDNLIKVWDMNKDFKCIRTVNNNDSYAITQLMLLKNGYLASAKSQHEITIFNYLSDYAVEYRIRKHTKRVMKMIELSNNILIYSTLEGVILIIDCKRQYDLVQSIKLPSQIAIALTPTHNDNFAAGTNMNKIIIFQGKKPFKELLTLYGHDSNVSCLETLNDNNLVSGSDDNTIRIWSHKDNYSCVQIIIGHSNFINCLYVMNDGNLISGSGDNKIKIWNAKNGFKCIDTIEGHKGEINGICQLIDGRIVSASNDYNTIVWNNL
jgi:WD40 repeat protein